METIKVEINGLNYIQFKPCIKNKTEADELEFKIIQLDAIYIGDFVSMLFNGNTVIKSTVLIPEANVLKFNEYMLK
jgi:hypothetical protein